MAGMLELILATGNYSDPIPVHCFFVCQIPIEQTSLNCQARSSLNLNTSNPRPVAALLGLFSWVQNGSSATVSMGPTSGHTCHTESMALRNTKK